MNRSFVVGLGIILLLMLVQSPLMAATPRELETGIAEYAFDHLGGASNLAPAAAASGVTIIYCNGVGGSGYNGLGSAVDMARERQASLAYLKQSRAQGIQLAIGYVCATSIVNLNTFDKNWTPEFCAQFRTPPAQWRQLDQNGHALPSWYGVPYEAACMNNPDWRTYEKFIVRSQLESGCDGIFFDNPTVHPKGCYCPFCMEKFDAFLSVKHREEVPAGHSFEALREWAVKHPQEFLEFRATIAADFLREMRDCARSIHPQALITCNNSLNSPGVLFSQCRTYGYDISATSAVEDFLTVEDMGSQARELADGRTIEYGPTYKQLQAISHGKPIVACTLADADYSHTSPHLARLSMAEAAANDASWLLWPVWPDSVSKAILPEALLLRNNEKLLNHSDARSDVVLFLPFRRWLETDHCTASTLAAALSQAGVQFTVCSEENLTKEIVSVPSHSPMLLIESYSVLNEEERRAIEAFKSSGGQVVAATEKAWMSAVCKAVGRPSIVLSGPASLRAVVRDQPSRTIVHLYNLNIKHLASFDDQVNPAQQIGITLRVPFKKVRAIHALSADSASTTGALQFTTEPGGGETIVHLTYPSLEVSAILVVER